MMLVFDHVCVFYGDTPVLRELSFQICSGEQVGLIGANGAGKSTLMKAALGLLPYTGSITVDGTPVTRKTLPEVRRKLGYVLQDADNQMFMPTVLDDMVFGPMNYGLSRAAAEQRAEETLAELHMEYLRDRHNHKMSGGEKRMAAVATILARQPQMLLMDEPFASLDFLTRGELQSQLLAIQKKLPRTIVLVTHQLEEALLLGQKIVVMHPDSTIREFDLSALPYPRDVEQPALRALKAEITDECRKPTASE